MKQHMSRAIFLALTVVCLFAFTADVIADDQTVNLQSAVIQDFDNPDAQPWFLIGSKFATKNYPKLSFVKTWPVSLHGANTEGKDLRSLGIAMLFDRMEYNWVDIVPGKKSGEGPDVTYAPIEIPLPGRVAMLDMWVWSGNFDYYIEAFVRDYKGIVYTLPMGNLTHIGWKNMRCYIPANIPQSKKYLPAKEGISLVKFRIWTRPTERVVMPVAADASDFEKAIYFYFDQIKVLTDTFETLYDGDSLSTLDGIKNLWGGEVKK